MSPALDEHRYYLADQERNAAFRKALHELIKPGAAVLDLGCGTGILGLLACQAGAARVYSVDSGGIIELARKLGQANNFADRIVYIKGMSTQVDLPEPVDLVIADQIGFGSEFGLFGYFDDARKRFLKPGGSMMPSCVEMHIAPVSCPELYADIAFWDGDQAGFDVRSAHTLAANSFYRTKYAPEQLLSAPAMGASVSLASASPEMLNFKAEFVVVREGTLHGITGWFNAQLAPDVWISNSPLAEAAIDRTQVFFPIEQPVDVREGDHIKVTMHILTADHVVTWTVEVFGPSGISGRARFTQSTWKSMLVAREDLHKTRSDFVPTLRPRARAWQTVIALCDGQRSVAEIERELYQRHPDLFHSPADAAALVAEAINSYGV